MRFLRAFQRQCLFISIKRRDLCFATCRTLMETSRKGHPRYDIYDYDEEYDAKPFKEKLRMNLCWLKDQFQLWKDEWKEHLQLNRRLIEDNEEVVEWKFESKESLKNWVVSVDSFWNEGFSTAKFDVSPQGHGLFHGNLDTSLPQNGEIYRAGWANITYTCPPLAFGKKNTFDWLDFTHLVMRVRGDGRAYHIVLRCPGYFDTTWMDFFGYTLYTHGGPYWQYVRIPFSKFVFASKGKLQDTQWRVNQGIIESFGISVMDTITGPFRLEIDYIAVVQEPGFKEEHAYEMYRVRDAKFVGP